MPTYISLLRGVNVGGHRKIKMQELQALYESLGYARVATYIQSGNVVFASRVKDCATIGKKIQAGIEQRFGFAVEIFVYALDTWRTLISENPFGADPEMDPRRLVVSFLAAPPAAEARETLKQVESGDDHLRFRERFVYLYCPNGYGQTKLSNIVIERKLKTTATARNWNTVNRLLAVAEEADRR